MEEINLPSIIIINLLFLQDCLCRKHKIMYEKFITIVREFNKFARHKINYKTNCNFMQQYQLKIKLKNIIY